MTLTALSLLGYRRIVFSQIRILLFGLRWSYRDNLWFFGTLALLLWFFLCF